MMTIATPASISASVSVARSWIGTPYHLGGRIRGAGADCATLIAEWMIECGIAEREDLGIYSGDWFCNTSEERYMIGILRHARRAIDARCRGSVQALPGSIALFRVARSRLYNHAAIITRWPYMVHAVAPRICESDATRHCLTSNTEMSIFDPWERTI
jgi:cell wall-associated NlpC family hydrolase